MPVLILKKIACYFIDNPTYLIIIVLTVFNLIVSSLNNSKAKEIANLTLQITALKDEIKSANSVISEQNNSIKKYVTSVEELNSLIEKAKTDKINIDKITTSKLSYTAPISEVDNFSWLLGKAQELTVWKK